MRVVMPHQCECHRCIEENRLGMEGPFGWVPLSFTKMILCPVCGCKRCPMRAITTWRAPEVMSQASQGVYQ